MKAKRAEVAVDDPRVVAHPAFRTIPGPQFPLESEQAQKEYNELAQRFYDAGRLTAEKHRALSSYASQFDAVACARAAGKHPPTSAYAALEATRNRLRIDEIDSPIAAPKGAGSNPFSRNGFPSRRR